MQRTGIEGYRGTPGNRGAWLLWRTEGDRAEFVTPKGIAHFAGCPHKGDHQDYRRRAELSAARA